jgi:hypothetical protein
MKKNKMLITLISIVLLYSCTSPTASTEVPAILPTLHPGMILTHQCLEVAPKLPPDVQPQGMLVLEEEHSFLLDLTTGLKTSLTDGKGRFKASPDGKWLASRYVDDDNNLWLSVDMPNGKREKLFPWDDDWFLLGGWLDNNHVWISHYEETLLTVINPFSGEHQEVIPDFPGIETASQLGERFALGASTVLYDSSMNLAVYPRLEEDGYVYVVLWDRQTNHILAKVKDISKSFSYHPIWSLDQKEVYVAVANRRNSPDNVTDNIFGLGQDGRVRQLTNFEDFYDGAYIGKMALSPDGEKIAFWVALYPSSYKDQQLVVLDLETQQVINYCVSGSYLSDAPSPVWSLDSRYLAVQNRYEPNVARILLVDTQQEWVLQIAELMPDGWPAGWLVSP